jgi:hypothetical protein
MDTKEKAKQLKLEKMRLKYAENKEIKIAKVKAYQELNKEKKKDNDFHYYHSNKKNILEKRKNKKI